MATLSIPHSFIPGTPALASEVNANFQAVVSWTQGQISTDNLGILGARSVALPSSPALAILSLAQTASQIALNVSNAGTESSVAISQSGALASGKAALLINSPNSQSNAGAAELLMTLAAGSTIPALLIQHGTDTLKLTSSQLTLFNSAIQATSSSLNLFNNAVQATSAGVLSATTVGATTANLTNANTTGLITATAPVSDAIAIKVKGRSSDNNAIVQFKSNDDATVYASATSSSSGLSLNLPDTADNYTFQINGVTKGVINNSGIDAQYLYNFNYSTLPAIPLTTISWGNTAYFISTGGGLSTYTLATGTVTTTQPGRIIIPNVLDNGITQSSGFVSVAFFATINGVNYGLNMPLLGGSINFRTFYYAASAGTYNISVSARVQEIAGSPPATGTLLAGSAQFVVLPG